MRLDRAAFGNGTAGIGKHYPEQNTKSFLFFVGSEWERDKECAGNIPTCQTIKMEPSPEYPNAKKGVVSPAIDMK